MSWPVDTARLERVRRLMAEEDLEALIVRSPDNLVYLTNYWCMKGYDLAIFPREGDPTLVVVAPQREDAERTAWTDDIRTFGHYDIEDPRPPADRALSLALAVVAERDLGRRVGIEMNQNAQSADRMVGEPTVYTRAYFDAFDAAAGEVVDATGLLVRARSSKTTQEIERMKLAQELATLGLEHIGPRIRPGMRESEVGAMFEGFVHETGIGYKDKVEMARAFTLVWSGPGIKTFTATGHRPVVENEPTLLEIWVCADGYWTDLTKNFCPGTLSARYVDLLDLLLETRDRALRLLRPGVELAEVDRAVRASLAAGGYEGQPDHAIAHGVGARAHEPPWAHLASPGVLEEGMVLAVEPGAYWSGGGGLRLEDDYLVTASGPERLGTFRDDFR
ncbi:MAG: Xaa-Pro peptidase family protein [Actinomycetota bacterium]|jgi:Xaa-Pro aminopeptidase|nr:Xaa-Pro peptidase family protein [Actinomycetota bacterium]